MKAFIKKFSVAAATLVMVAAGTFSTGASAKSNKEIRIGVAGPHSGANADRKSVV